MTEHDTFLSIQIAEEYVAWALANGFTTSDIAYALGYPKVLFPSRQWVVDMVAFIWRTTLRPVEMRRAA